MPIEDRDRMLQDEEIVDKEDYYLDQDANDDGTFSVTNPAYWQGRRNDFTNLDWQGQSSNPPVPESQDALAQLALEEEYGEDPEFYGGQIPAVGIISARNKVEDESSPTGYRWLTDTEKKAKDLHDYRMQHDYAYALSHYNEQWDDYDRQYMKAYHAQLAANATTPISETVNEMIGFAYAHAPQFLLGSAVTGIGIATANPFLISYGGGQLARSITNMARDSGVISNEEASKAKKVIGIGETVGSLGGGLAVGAIKAGGKKLLTKAALKQIGKRVAKEAYKQGIYDVGSLSAEELLRLGLKLKGQDLADWINERPEKRGWAAAGVQFLTYAITTAAEANALVWVESALASVINDKPIYASGLLGRINETMDMGIEAAPITQFGKFKRDEDGNIMYDENGHPIEELSYYDMTLWQQMGTATFWQNQIGSAGFSAGSAIGGAQMSRRLGGVTGELRAIKHGVKAEDLFKTPMSMKSKALFDTMNGLAMAAPEASVEAYSAYNDYIRNNTEKIRQDYLDGKIDAEQYQQALSVLGEGARVFGNQVFYENMAILTASNAIVWGQMYSRGYSSAVRSGGGIGTAIRAEWAKPAVSEAETAAKRFGINVVRDTSGKIATGATIQSVGKTVGKSGLELLKKGLSEGLEEGLQGVAQSKAQFMPELTSYYYNSTRPDGWRMAKEYLMGTYQSLLYNAKGGDQSYEQMMGGFIMGMAGMPGMTRNQRGRIAPTWNGGIGETVRDIRDYTKARGFTERLNAQLQDENSDISIVLKTLAGQASDSMDARLALLQNDNFGFENARENSLIRTLYMSEALGLSEELYGNVAETAIHMTEDEVNNLRQMGIIENISISSAEYAKKVNEFGSTIRDKIDKFKKNLGTAAMLGLDARDAEIFTAAALHADNFAERAKTLQKEIEDAIGMSFDDFYEGDGKDRKLNYEKLNKKINEVAATDPTVRTKEDDRLKNVQSSNAYTQVIAAWMRDPISMSRAIDNEMNVRLSVQDGMKAAMLASEIAKAKSKDEVLDIIRKSGATDEVAKTALTIAAQEGSSLANSVRRSRDVRSKLMRYYGEQEYTTIDGKKVSGSDIIDAIMQEVESSGKRYTDLRYEDIAKLLLGKFKVMLQQDELIKLMGALSSSDIDASLMISIQDASYNSKSAKGERKQSLPNLPIRLRKRAEERKRLQDEMRQIAKQYDPMNTTGAVVNVKYNGVDYTIEQTDNGLEIKDNNGNTAEERVANKIIKERGRELRKRVGSMFYDTEWNSLSTTDKVIAIQSIVDDMPASRSGRYVLVSTDAQIDALDVSDEVKKLLRKDPGLTADGTIYINASNATSINDLVKTYLHESAHFGLRNLFATRSGNTDRFDRLCVSLFNYASRADEKSRLFELFEDIASRYLGVTDTRNSNGELSKRENQELIGDEIFAHLAERMINDETNEFEKSGFFSIVRASLRSLVRDRLGIDIGFTDNDIRALITRGLNRIEHGKINENVTFDETRERIAYDENERKNVTRLDNEEIVSMLSDGDISQHTVQDFEKAKDLLGLLQKQFGAPALLIASENHEKAVSKYIRDIINKDLDNVRKNGREFYGLRSGTERNNLYINFKIHNSLNELARTYIHEMIHYTLKEYLGEDIYKKAMTTLWHRIKRAKSPLSRIEESNSYKNLPEYMKGEECLARITEEQITENGEIAPLNRELELIDKRRINQINDHIIGGTFSFDDSLDLLSALLRHQIYTSKKSEPKYMPYVIMDPSTGDRVEEGVLEYGIDGSIRNVGDRTIYDKNNERTTLSFRNNTLYQIVTSDDKGNVLSIIKKKGNYIVKEDANGKVISKELITRSDGLNANIRKEYDISFMPSRSMQNAEREDDIESEIERHASNDKDYMSREERRKRSGLIRERISSRRREMMSSRLRNKLTGISEEEISRQIELIDEFGESIKKGGASKYEEAALYWLMQGTIILPQDGYKVKQAIEYSERYHLNALVFDNPQEFINFIEENFNSKGKSLRPVNPDNYDKLTNKKVLENGIVVYDVENSEEGRKQMRKIMDSHLGKKLNPWCLLHAENGKLTASSYDNWYNIYPGEKKAAFQNGRLIAFYSDNSFRGHGGWWDLYDNVHEGIPIEYKIKGDSLGRSTIVEANEKTGEIASEENLEYSIIFKGRKGNGKYTEWYSLDPSSYRIEENYKDAKRDGVRRGWYENGNLTYEFNYKDDMLDGTQREWRKNGKKLYEHNYKKGTQDGLQKQWYENGNLEYEIIYDYSKGKALVTLYSETKSDNVIDTVLIDEYIFSSIKGQNLLYNEAKKISESRNRNIRERKRGTEGRNELRLQSVVRNIIRSKADSLKRSNPEMFSECKQMLYDMIMKRIADGEQLKLRASTIKGIKMMLDGELTEEEFDKSEDYYHLRGQWDKWGNKINAARRYIRDNWDAVLSEVARELAHDEGIIISTNMMSEKQYRNILENEGYEKDEIDTMMGQYNAARSEIESSDATDEIDLGLKEEYFDYSVRYTDEVLTMSNKMHVELANLVQYDKDGNMKLNENTGLPSRQNSKYIYYVLVEQLSDCKNKKEFFTRLKALENRFAWARDLIAKVEADPDMRAGVYATFRKSTVVPRVLDSMTGKIHGHFENTAMRFRARLIYENFGRNVTNDAVFGNDGLVKDKGKVNALIRQINKFVDKVNDGIDEETFKKQMCEFFSQCGLVVEPDDIRGDLINKKFNLNAMIDFLEAMRDGKLSNVMRLDTARKLRGMLEVTERTAHIGMLRLNGVSYAAHVPMSYLEDRLLNLCRGDSKSIAEYVRKKFGEYENFASHVDGDTIYFFDWLEDLAYERLGLEYAEVMSISGRAPEKAIKSVADYISMAFQVYRSSSESERFVLPCLGHSGRLMYIDHEGRMSNEDIREGLKKVVMRENKLACMKIGGKETGSKDFAMIPELPGLLKSGKVVLRNRDGSSIRLDMETLLSDDFTEEMAGACADALIDNIRNKKIDEELYDYWVTNEDEGSSRYHKKDKFASQRDFESVYRDFLVRNYYAQTQIAAMIGADPAFFDSDVNYSKRLQGLQSCNTRPSDQSEEGENDKMGVVILKDEVVDCIRDHKKTAELIDAMESDGRFTHEQAEKARGRLSNVTATDGQSYMTLDSYRDYLMSVNHWDEHLEEKYQAVKRGEFMDIEDFQNSFTPLKLAGYGEYVQELPDGTKIKRPYMIKTSFMPILPIQNMSDDMPGLGNKKLMAIAEYMEKTGAKIACFESSCKVGSKDALSVEDILSGKGGNVAFEIDSWELGMQQVENTEATDVEVSSGRQRINLALTNIRAMGSLEIGGKAYTAEQVEKIYLAALAAKAEKKYRDVVAPLLESEESIVEEVEDMARRLGEASGLDGFEEAVKQGLPMHAAPGQSVLQGVILSMLKNGAISNRQYGQVNVQCYAYSDDLNLVIRESKDGRKYLAGMECYMPAPSKKIIEKYATQEGGVWRIDMEKMPDELKKAIGTRIPTAGYGAMKVLYVKGFLNPVHGSQIMLPVEAMVFDGSDFDIDKIFEICPHFETKEDGNLGKVEYAMPTDATGKLDEVAMSKLSIAQLDNLLMDINELIWASPEGTAQIMQAGGYASIQDAKVVLEYIEEQRRKGYIGSKDIKTVEDLEKKLRDGTLKKKSGKVYNPLSLEACSDAYFKGQLGKNIIAVIAATNAFVPSIQRSNVDLGALSIRLGGDEYRTLAPVKGRSGQYSISLLGEKIDAAADMRKDDCLYSLCKDPNQAALSIALSILGIDPIHEVIFLNQPEVREYIKAFNGKQMTCYDILKFFGMQRVSPEGLFTEEDKNDKPMSWDEMLARTMAAPGSTEAQNDPRIVKQLIKLFLISQAITDANLYTSRFDKSDQGGFTGSTFAEYIDKMMRVRLGGDLSMQRIPALRALKEQLRQIAFKDDGTVDVENSKDRRQAILYKLTFEDFRKEISKDGKFPWLTDEGIAVIENLYKQYGHYDYTTGTWESSMNSELLESLINEYSQALMQNNDLFCRYVDEGGNEYIRYEALIRMIALFPKRIADFKYNEGFSNNPFLQALSMSENDRMLKYTIPNLDGLNLEQIEAIRSGWAALLDNSQTNRFALDMYRYALLISPGLTKYVPKAVIEAFYDENGNASDSLNEDGGAKEVMEPSFSDELTDGYSFSDFIDAWTDKNMVEGSLYTFISARAAEFHIKEAKPKYRHVKKYGRWYEEIAKRGRLPWECNEIWLTDNLRDDRMGTDNKTAPKYINWDGYIFKYNHTNIFGFPQYMRVDGIQLDDGAVKNYCNKNRSIRNDLDRLALIKDVNQYGIDNANEIASEIDDFGSFAGFDNEENNVEQFTAEDYLEKKSAIEPTEKPNSELRRVFFDVETSDVYDKTKEGNLEEMPHVFQIGYVVTDFDGKVIEGDSILIKPDGWTISDEAAKVTGHTTEEIAKDPNAMSAKKALGRLAQIMNDADCVVGHNVIFDNTVISAEFARAGLANPLIRADLKVVDTMRTSYPNKLKDSNGNKKFWTNYELYKELGGEESVKLHDALEDVRVTMANFTELQKRGYLNNDTAIRERRRITRRAATSFTDVLDNLSNVKEESRVGRESACRGADGKNLC